MDFFQKIATGIIFLVGFTLPISITSVGKKQIDAPDITTTPTSALPVIDFLEDTEYEFGPPLPHVIDIPLKITGKVDQDIAIDLSLISFTDMSGESLVPSKLVIPCKDNIVPTIDEELSEQIVVKQLCFDTSSQPLREVYTGILQAKLGQTSIATQNITINVGPPAPPRIISSEIIITARGCPLHLNNLKENIRKIFVFLCPGQLKNGRFLATPLEDTDTIQLSEPVPSGYGNISRGSAINQNGEGIVGFSLDVGDLNKNCKDTNRTNYPLCYAYDLDIQGSTNSGTYKGIFYLDPTNQETEEAKVNITMYVYDHWPLPLIVLSSGVILNILVSWYLGPRKDANKKKVLNETVKKKEKVLRTRVNSFTKEIESDKNKLKFYSTSPAIIREIELYLDKGEEKNLQTVQVFTVLFDEFCYLFDLQQEFFKQFHQIRTTIQNCSNEHKAVVEKMKEEFLHSKRMLWISTSQQEMESAKDATLRAAIGLDDLNMLPPCDALEKALPFKKLEIPRQQAEDEQNSSSQTEENKTSLSDYLLRVLRNWPHFIRWGIVITSGFYLIYLSNPTFGSQKDYFLAFLWGTTTESVLKAISSLIGSENNLFTSIVGIFKK